MKLNIQDSTMEVDMKVSVVQLLIERPNIGMGTVILRVFHEPEDDPVEVARGEFDWTGTLLKSAKVTPEAFVKAVQIGGDLIAVRRRK